VTKPELIITFLLAIAAYGNRYRAGTLNPHDVWSLCQPVLQVICVGAFYYTAKAFIDLRKEDLVQWRDYRPLIVSDEPTPIPIPSLIQPLVPTAIFLALFLAALLVVSAPEKFGDFINVPPGPIVQIAPLPPPVLPPPPVPSPSKAKLTFSFVDFPRGGKPVLDIEAPVDNNTVTFRFVVLNWSDVHALNAELTLRLPTLDDSKNPIARPIVFARPKTTDLFKPILNGPIAETERIARLDRIPAHRLLNSGNITIVLPEGLNPTSLHIGFTYTCDGCVIDAPLQYGVIHLKK